MKRFIFRHSRLLNLKQQQVRLAEIDLAKMNGQIAELNESLDRISSQITGYSKTIQNGPAEHVLAMCHAAAALRTKTTQLRNHLANKRIELAEKLKTLSRAKRSAESFSELKKRQWQSYQKEASKRQQAEIDAYASIDLARRRND